MIGYVLAFPVAIVAALCVLSAYGNFTVWRTMRSLGIPEKFSMTGNPLGFVLYGWDTLLIMLGKDRRVDWDAMIDKLDDSDVEEMIDLAKRMIEYREKR